MPFINVSDSYACAVRRIAKPVYDVRVSLCVESDPFLI